MAVLLVGTDFSTRSDRALRRATMLARQADYELLIVHVIDDDQAERMVQAERRAAAELLAEMEETIRQQDHIRCRTEVRLGQVPDQMIMAAGEVQAELMLIGPYRRAIHRFGGTTAERIIRKSPVPMIVAASVPTAPYSRLLLPTEMNSASRRVVAQLRDLGVAKSAEFIFLHVRDPDVPLVIVREGGQPEEMVLEADVERARAELAEFMRLLRESRAEQLVREIRRPIADEIDQVAADTDADLIVLPHSNKSRVERVVLGSVTKEVLRSGRFDVLVMP